MSAKGKMTKITNADLMGEIEKLKARYPHEKRLAVWMEWYVHGDYLNKDPHFRFVAVIGESGDDNESVYGQADNLQAAVESAIEKAGDRDPKALLRARVWRMREDLAKLETRLANLPTELTLSESGFALVQEAAHE